jgi:hypothetical protein
MDDDELWQHFSTACLVWATTNGDEDATRLSFTLRSVADVVQIRSWLSSAPQPSTADLKAVGVDACNSYVAMELLRQFMTPDYTVVSATQAQIDAVLEPPQGAIVINTDLAAFQVYIDGAWVTVSSLARGPPKMVYPVEIIDKSEALPPGAATSASLETAIAGAVAKALAAAR